MNTIRFNDLGEKYLVEDSQKIVLSEFIKKYRHELREAILHTEIEIFGNKIELVTTKPNYGGYRIWFKCPMCGKRKGVLFKHPAGNLVGCRKCLDLEYRKRRYRGMIEEKIGGEII